MPPSSNRLTDPARFESSPLHAGDPRHEQGRADIALQIPRRACRRRGAGRGRACGTALAQSRGAEPRHAAGPVREHVARSGGASGRCESACRRCRLSRAAAAPDRSAMPARLSRSRNPPTRRQWRRAVEAARDEPEPRVSAIIRRRILSSRVTEPATSRRPFRPHAAPQIGHDRRRRCHTRTARPPTRRRCSTPAPARSRTSCGQCGRRVPVVVVALPGDVEPVQRAARPPARPRARWRRTTVHPGSRRARGRRPVAASGPHDRGRAGPAH